ncbi:MAG TPA: lasso RiPP family leader peptide-containing protein [Thermoanaerobaculia bacterium]|jgi:hypothetical protein|nr:lasso RiPP family leader peptide-containing protein [Thermoanaerobaculia bacterium]
MSKETETKLEPDSGKQSPEAGCSRRPYESPQLLDWGSIVELTGGDFQPPGDAEGGGSGAA